MKSFLKYWLPVCIWIALIFVGSTDVLSAGHTSRFLVPFLRWLKPDISAEALSQIQFLIRKAGHVTEYAILSMLLWRALWNSLRSTTRVTIALWTLGACAIFAASDEFHQSFVASRTATVDDVLIDTGGAVIGLLICRILAKRKQLPAE